VRCKPRSPTAKDIYNFCDAERARFTAFRATRPTKKSSTLREQESRHGKDKQPHQHSPLSPIHQHHHRSSPSSRLRRSLSDVRVGHARILLTDGIVMGIALLWQQQWDCPLFGVTVSVASNDQQSRLLVDYGMPGRFLLFFLKDILPDLLFSFLIAIFSACFSTFLSIASFSPSIACGAL
jgi:hypothetical protein